MLQRLCNYLDRFRWKVENTWEDILAWRWINEKFRGFVTFIITSTVVNRSRQTFALATSNLDHENAMKKEQTPELYALNIQISSSLPSKD